MIRSGTLRGCFALIAIAVLGACGDSTSPSDRSFLDGTNDNPEIGLVENSTGKALTLFQLGNPSEQRQIPLGASSAVTPSGVFAVRGMRAAVPLGNAASVALVDLAGAQIERFFTFPSGNATGVAFADDNTLLAANLIDDYVGRATLDQAGGTFSQTVAVAPAPTSVVVGAGRAFVISGNLDETFATLGNGIVTAIDPTTLAVLGSVQTGGTNSSAAALGPDGRLYVLNTEDFVNDGSVTVIDPATLQVINTVGGFGPGPGSIHIDANGLLYASSFSTGTVVYNTVTGAFVRGPDDPVCARRTQTAGAPCRGAADATPAADGSIYQLFFGSPADGLPPYTFVYAPGTYQLVDSVAVGVGPAAIQIGTFRSEGS